ncbi:MAG: tRNA (adenosine(37)-N6)-threonylcarbamoyltransferase complex ATPase subunit type 1 TsaE [Syntrophorhabdales bacterium]|jgi:tRNA threonylcarbamoyladenosine biosynthesis protein TsaE
MERIEFISRSPSETIAIGAHIGRLAEGGDLFLLYGELGAGKTQLVKGLAKGMGVPDWQYVLSPSFTLMSTYEGRLVLCHVDLYRLEGPDADDLGIEDFLEGGVVAVEWAERAPSWKDGIKITLQAVAEEERTIVMEVEDARRAQIWRHVRRHP